MQNVYFSSERKEFQMSRFSFILAFTAWKKKSECLRNLMLCRGTHLGVSEYIVRCRYRVQRKSESWNHFRASSTSGLHEIRPSLSATMNPWQFECDEQMIFHIKCSHLSPTFPLQPCLWCMMSQIESQITYIDISLLFSSLLFSSLLFSSLLFSSLLFSSSHLINL